MQLPIITPAPIVSKHAQVFRPLFNDVRQYQNFQNYLTGLIVLENKSLANMSSCIINSVDKSNLSRFMGESPWQPKEVNRVRSDYLLEQTAGIRMAASESYFILDDTWCEHVGSLFEYVDRHYDHCDGSYPLAHNLVTSHYLSGAMRMPIHAEIYQRDETVTQWEQFILKHFPDQEIPKTATQRTKVHKKCAPKLLEDPEFLELHQQFRTKIEIAQTLLTKAVAQGVTFTTMLMDSWYLTPALVKTLASIQDSSPRPTTPHQSIGAVCRQQAQSLLEQLILFAHDRLLHGCSAAQLFTTLFAKQHPTTRSSPLVFS